MFYWGGEIAEIWGQDSILATVLNLQFKAAEHTSNSYLSWC
jgi:hypothetical protein